MCRCATRLNFLANAEKLAEAFHHTFELINLDRWLQHVAKCTHPLCGLVVAVDGTCKVFREICGAPKEPPAAFEESESDVQNVMARHCLRQKVCDEQPGRKVKGNARYCKECNQSAYLVHQPEDQEEHGEETEPPAKSQRTLRPRNVPVQETIDEADSDDEVVERVDDQLEVGICL